MPVKVSDRRYERRPDASNVREVPRMPDAPSSVPRQSTLVPYLRTANAGRSFVDPAVRQAWLELEIRFRGHPTINFSRGGGRRCRGKLRIRRKFGLSSNGCGWVEARSAGRRGVLAVHLTGGGRGAPWPGVGRSGVAAGRPACQRATRVLRCAAALRVTHRPSLRSSSRYGPCGPAWTGASRPSTTTRKARRLAVRG